LLIYRAISNVGYAYIVSPFERRSESVKVGRKPAFAGNAKRPSNISASDIEPEDEMHWL